MHADAPHAWAPMDASRARSLSDARRQLHLAVQFGASFGISYLRPAHDDGHTNLGWNPLLGAFVSRGADTAAGQVAVGIRATDLTLLVTHNGSMAASQPLHGQTLAASTAWLRAALAAEGLDGAKLTLERHYTIPDHAVATGAAFDASDHEAFDQLARWFGNGALELESLAAEMPGASDVRLWPHHFDNATLVALGGGRSAGAGLVGGDSYYDEPYFYVNMDPQPQGALPDAAVLGGGSWHTHEWIGAVLPGSQVTGGAAAQHALVHRYLRASHSTCRALAGG
jgi:hypothetical protein